MSSLSSLALTAQSSSNVSVIQPPPRSFLRLVSWRKKLQAPTTQSLDQLPPELLLYTAQSFLSTRDALNLCTTSSAFRSLLISYLFTSIKGQTLEQCTQQLDFLIREPCVARNISKLVLRPSHSSTSSSQALQGEELLVQRLESLAPELVSLRTFIWDGHEMPSDSVWATLRTCCPGLHYISTSVGLRPILAESELFKFESLVGFSFVTKRTTPPWLEDGTWNVLSPLPSEQLPTSLWDMLYRFKDLEELELGGVGHSLYTRLLNVLPLTQGRWPKMRSLKLGHVSLQEEPKAGMNPFERFVSTHKNLKELSLPYPTRIMPLQTLVRSVTIESYSGTFPYLGDMFASCNLTTLSLCTEPHSAWYIPFIRQTLQLCTSLTSLSMWIDLSNRELQIPPGLPNAMVLELRETDHIKIFRSILHCCPKLLHLKLLCSTKRKYGFKMEEFPKALEGGPKLKTLEVQKVTAYVEHGMSRSTVDMARQCPSLEKVTLRYGIDVWSDLRPFEMMGMGVYDLIADETGNLVELHADEVNTRFTGLHKRRYQRDLRPQRGQLAQMFARK